MSEEGPKVESCKIVTAIIHVNHGLQRGFACAQLPIQSPATVG